MLSERVSRLIERTYAAAEGAEPWMAPLGELRQLLKGRMTSLLEYHGQHHPGIVREAVGLDPSYQESYERYYWRCNVYLQRAAGLLRPGMVAPHEMYCSDQDILRSEYYQDFQRHLGLFRVIAGVLTCRRGTLLLTVSRSARDREFSSEETALVRLLLPHFQRAISISERLAPASAPAIVDARGANHARPLGLTATETAMASHLAAGHSIPEICHALRIRETTARTHLRHLFQKTETRRQAELVAWLLRDARRADRDA